MVKKSITIGEIFSIIGAIIFAVWMLSFLMDFNKDPTDIKHIETATEKMADQAIPPQANIIMKLAPYGGVGAILIILVIIFWSKIMDIKLG